ncbi:MAG: hypothetical protein ACP6IY_11105, partial [Promethearchaeia archaeon]
LISEMAKYNFFSRAGYFIENIPNNNKINTAEESISQLIKMIHNDDKEIGIVKMPSISDEKDGDNDLSKIVKNIYNIKFNWDFSVSMIYRTQHLPDLFDYLIEDMSKYDYTNEYELEYTQESDLERYLMPKSTFFYKVSYEIYNTEVNVEKQNRYIFIGTFSTKFKDTSYIKNKEYLKDLDICRYLGVKKIFMYDYNGFIARYGKSELNNLIDHIKENISWYLNIPNYYIQRELIISIIYATIDKLIYL